MSAVYFMHIYGFVFLEKNGRITFQHTLLIKNDTTTTVKLQIPENINFEDIYFLRKIQTELNISIFIFGAIGY
jgi:hypothetical protein